MTIAAPARAQGEPVHWLSAGYSRMKLRTINLNLLLVFATVYREGSISKAAVALHLTQPAVSNALARLREQFDDVLFERDGSGMRPTPRARALIQPVQEALNILEHGLKQDETFDFSTSTRSFIIAVGDYGETVFIPRFVNWLAQVAPHVHIQIRPEPSAGIQDELRSGKIDLALDYFILERPEFFSKCLLTDTLLTLARPDHPGIGDELDLDTYLALRHVILEPREGTNSLIDLALAKRNLKRTIAVTVPHFQSMPVIVHSSDLVCTMPCRMANLYLRHFDLAHYTVPLRTPKFPIYMIWHHTLKDDPGHGWLRNSIMEFARQIEQEGYLETM